MDPLERLRVDHWEILRVEQRGAAAKWWLLEDGHKRDEAAAQWLFKPAHVHENGTRQIGDWTEVIASLVAERLEIPSAKARLGVRSGVEGVLVRNVRPDGFEMHSGTLALWDRGIELDRADHDGPATRGHSLENIGLALDGMSEPPDSPSWEGCSAFDTYAGFLLLDALIANGDRHEENWSILRGITAGSDALAPSYDLENSLGFQLGDGQRAAHLKADSCRRYAQNGLAKRLDGDRRNTLVSVSSRAYGEASERGRKRLDRLVDEISGLNFDELIPEAGPMSEVTRMFAVSLLTINARRIADAIDHSR